MPELPDVENFGRYLRKRALHKSICAADIGSTKVLSGVSGKEAARALRGRRLESTRRHGKHLFVALDRNGWIGLHFGMTGCLKYFKRLEDDPKHDRLRLDFDNGYHLAYDDQRMLGRIRLLEDPDAFIASRKLGPDALDPSLDRQPLRSACAAAAGRSNPPSWTRACWRGSGIFTPTRSCSMRACIPRHKSRS